MVASVYHDISKEVENRIFRHNCIFRHTCIYKQSILVVEWNYSSGIIICSCKFCVVILDTWKGSWMFYFLFFFVRNQEEKIELQQKSTMKNLCAEHHFFGSTYCSLCHFLSLFSSNLNFKKKKLLKKMAGGLMLLPPLHHHSSTPPPSLLLPSCSSPPALFLQCLQPWHSNHHRGISYSSSLIMYSQLPPIPSLGKMSKAI